MKFKTLFHFQTIQIRKFLRELEHDALLLDQKLNASYGRVCKDDLKNFVWFDDDQIGEVFKEGNNRDAGSRDMLDNDVGDGHQDGLQLSPGRSSQSRQSTSNNPDSIQASGSTFQ